MTKKIWLGVYFVVTFALVGCGGEPATQTSAASPSSAAPPIVGGESEETASTAGTGGAGSIGVFSEGPGSIAEESLLNTLVVYFDFDRSEILPESRDLLAAHGEYLLANQSARLRLEGHADERGTREYNIGLGERRAQAVRRVLLLQGASSDQMGTVSYGEERPAVFGSDEDSYEQNRRVELVYRQ